MHIEFSITVWPVVSMLLRLLLWMALTCMLCTVMYDCWQEAKEKNWRRLAFDIPFAIMIWLSQWYQGYKTVEWLRIVLGG